MVKKGGRKQAGPENDPHHLTLHVTHNLNATKGKYQSDKRTETQRVNNSNNTIGQVHVNQSFLAQPKQLHIIALPQPKNEIEKALPNSFPLSKNDIANFVKVNLLDFRS